MIALRVVLVGVSVAACALSADLVQAEIFKCVESGGRITYDIKQRPGCTRLNVGPPNAVQTLPKQVSTAKNQLAEKADVEIIDITDRIASGQLPSAKGEQTAEAAASAAGPWTESELMALEGEYFAKGHLVNVATQPDKIMARITTKKASCTGTVTLRNSSLAHDEKDGSMLAFFKQNDENDDTCTIRARFARDHKTVIVAETTAACRSFRGAECDFNGTLTKTDRLGASMARLEKDFNPKTLVESSPPGARIIVDGEYVGTAPLRVDISSAHRIRANPVTVGGCVQQEHLDNGSRIPKRIFFDTHLCPVPSKLDVNIN